MRSSGLVGVCILAVAMGIAAPSVARADDKEECFNAAEKAQKLKNEKKLSQAREQVLTCARDKCPAIVKSDCVKWLAEIDAAMPSVVIRARDKDGHDIIDVKVYVDDRLLMSQLQGTSVPLDPGQHKLRYEGPNGTSGEETVLIAEGEKDRVLRVELKAGAATASSGAGAGQAAGGGGEETGTKTGGPGVVPWIIGGVGLASLIGFGIMEIPIQSGASDLQNGCGKTKSCTQAQIDSVQSLYVPAGILMGVGFAGLAVGATWLIVATVTGGKSSHEAPAAAGLRIAPLPGGGGMIGYGGRF